MVCRKSYKIDTDVLFAIPEGSDNETYLNDEPYRSKDSSSTKAN